MVGASADNADAYPVALVPAGESIDDVDAVARVEEVNGTLAIDAPDLERRLVASKIETHVRDFQMRAVLKATLQQNAGEACATRQGCGEFLDRVHA